MKLKYTFVCTHVYVTLSRTAWRVQVKFYFPCPAGFYYVSHTSYVSHTLQVIMYIASNFGIIWTIYFHISLVLSYIFLPLYFNFVPSLFLIWLTLVTEYAQHKLGISEWFSLNISKEPMHCDWRIINKITSIRLKKYAHKFVLGHDLFLSAHNFTWALLLGTDNIRGQIL